MFKPFILEDISQFQEILEKSKNPNNNGVLVFKHSTRCFVSSMAYRGLKKEWKFDEVLPIYYLDLIKHRSLSNALADDFNVRHESPQLLYIKDGNCIENASHSDVNVEQISSWLNA